MKRYPRERVLHEVIFDNTSTIELMDKFTKLDENRNWVYDRMILNRYYKKTRGLRYEQNREFFSFSYIIEHAERGQEWYANGVVDLTMSDFKNGRIGLLNLYILDTIPYEKMKECKETHSIAYFDLPFLLRAQNSCNRTYGDGLLYGETKDYAIVGVLPDRY